MTPFHCPACGERKLYRKARTVTASVMTKTGEVLRRRYKCIHCDTSYSSYEQIEVKSATPAGVRAPNGNHYKVTERG